MARIKIADMEVGQTYECPLAVVSATGKTTRTGNPYLVMELYDGFDTIQCNYWDWKGENGPKRNTVYDFKVECSEYMGKKQLTCRHVKVNTTDALESFMPQGTHDVAQAYKDAYELLSEIEDDFYRTIGLHIFEETRTMWLHVPGAKTVHHNYMGGTLVHSLGVARKAIAIAEVTEGVWMDLVVIGALFHDIGKLFTYNLNGLAIDMTEEGQLFDHVFIGAEFVGNMSEEYLQSPWDEMKLNMLRHVILSHHARKEFGAPVTPKCIEAHIIAHADGLDVAEELINEASRKAGETRWTDKIWALDNMPHITINAMQALADKPYELPGPIFDNVEIALS